MLTGKDLLRKVQSIDVNPEPMDKKSLREYLDLAEKENQQILYEQKLSKQRRLGLPIQGPLTLEQFDKSIYINKRRSHAPNITGGTMIDAIELRDNLDKSLDAQRDALQESIDAAYKFGLNRGSEQQRARTMRWLKENSAHYAGNISYSNYELFMETLVVAFEKAMSLQEES